MTEDRDRLPEVLRTSVVEDQIVNALVTRPSVGELIDRFRPQFVLRHALVEDDELRADLINQDTADAVNLVLDFCDRASWVAVSMNDN